MWGFDKKSYWAPEGWNFSEPQWSFQISDLNQFLLLLWLTFIKSRKTWLSWLFVFLFAQWMGMLSISSFGCIPGFTGKRRCSDVWNNPLRPPQSPYESSYLPLTLTISTFCRKKHNNGVPLQMLCQYVRLKSLEHNHTYGIHVEPCLDDIFNM